MIKSIRIENYRGIKDLEIDNFKKYNFFIGDNGSKKTTILESVGIGLSLLNFEKILGSARNRKMKIKKEIIDLLERCEAEGQTLRITEQLDRKTYAQLNKVLTAIGGKWNAKQRVHLFQEDVSEMIENIINTGEYSCIKKDFQFFPTPIELARKMIKLAEITTDDICLEPSAGVGNIAQFMPNCDVIELHEDNRKTLTEKGFSLVHDDFLTFVPENKYTAIVMNPPFSKGQDIEHVTKAIEIAERVVVAVTSASAMFRNDNKTVAFRELVASHGGTIEELPVDSFKESGTSVNTCLIVVKK